MCFGTPKAVKQAAQIQAQVALDQQQMAKDALAKQQSLEAETKNRIQTGQESINNAFSGFDDTYYDRYRKSVIDASLPSLQRQYKEAKTNAFDSLAGKGTLDSSYGSRVLGDIERQYGASTTDLSTQAANAAANLRQQTEGSRASLTALNTGAADPSALASQAIGSSTALQQIQPQQIDMGSVFSSIVNPLLQFATARSQQIPGFSVASSDMFGGGKSSSGGRSVSVVR